MSSSRTTAAQRRRNGPPDLQGQRGPGTSIQSTSAFSQPPQIRPGTTGRLAGQQASLAQSQQQQQQQQQNNTANSNSKPKMSVPQAITLITLRLGRLENQIQNLDSLEQGESQGVNNELIEHIIQRLDNLEQKMVENDYTKQQLELIKPVTANTKTLATTSSKEIKELKTTIDKLKNDLNSLQNIVSFLQTMVNGESETEANHITYLEVLKEETEETEEPEPEEETSTDSQEINNNLTSINLKDIVENE